MIGKLLLRLSVPLVLVGLFVWSRNYNTRTPADGAAVIHDEVLTLKPHEDWWFLYDADEDGALILKVTPETHPWGLAMASIAASKPTDKEEEQILKGLQPVKPGEARELRMPVQKGRHYAVAVDNDADAVSKGRCRLSWKK